MGWFQSIYLLPFATDLNDVNKKDALKSQFLVDFELKEVWKILIKDISVKKFLIAFLLLAVLYKQ